jgi:hypothetical protein
MSGHHLWWIRHHTVTLLPVGVIVRLIHLHLPLLLVLNRFRLLVTVESIERIAGLVERIMVLPEVKMIGVGEIIIALIAAIDLLEEAVGSVAPVAAVVATGRPRITGSLGIGDRELQIWWRAVLEVMTPAGLAVVVVAVGIWLHLRLLPRHLLRETRVITAVW